MRSSHIVSVFALASTTLLGAESRPKADDVVKLPPVIVENSQPKVNAAIVPQWKEALVASGVIWRLDDAKRTQSFLFDENAVVRVVFGTKALLREDGSITAGF